MKRLLSFLLVILMMLSSILAMIPAGAVAAGPYNYTVGSIESITIENTKKLDQGQAIYYNATVNSSWHGLKKTYYDLNTHLVIGGEDTKFFVYSAETDNKLGYSKKTVDDLVKAFEAENPDYMVLAAVNGDFFNTNSGEPEEPMIQNGQMLKSFLLPDSERRGGGLVGIDDKTGELVYHTIGSAYKNAGYGTTYSLSSDYKVQVLDEDTNEVLTSYSSSIASAPTTSQVSFTTSDNGGGSYSGCTVYVVELDRYRKDTGSKNNKSFTSTYNYFAEGKIVDVISGTSSMKPQAGKAYIAVKSKTQAPALAVGATVRCQKVLTGDWANVSNAIGFKQQILAEGNLMFYNAYSRNHTGDGASQSATEKWTEDIYDYPHCWKARTAIGFKADGTPVFMAIPYNGKLGATYYEMSEQFKALGCTDAFLLDGGGSSTMVIRDGNNFNTVCHAEDGNDGEGRSIANIAIMAVRKDGGVAIETEKETEKQTEKQTEKKTNKKTDKKTDAAEETTENAGSESVMVNDGGCGGAIMFPAVIVTAVAGAGLIGIKKKKRK